MQFAGEAYGQSNLFGALNSMEENWDDLDNMERAAYKQVKRELEKELKAVRILEDDGQPDWLTMTTKSTSVLSVSATTLMTKVAYKDT